MVRFLIRTSLTQLVRYGGQSALVLLGIAIGVANIIALTSITDLGRRQTMGVINDIGANVLVVMPYIDTDSGAVSHIMSSFTAGQISKRIVEAVAQAEGIEKTAPVTSLPGHVGYGSERVFTNILGVNENFLELRGHSVATGRFMTPAEFDGGALVVCLGQSVATQLFGEGEEVGSKVVIKGKRFLVIGLMVEKGKLGMEDIDRVAVIPISTAQAIFGIDGCHGLFARHSSHTTPDQAVASINRSVQEVINPGELASEVVTVLTMKDATRLMESTLGIFKAILVGVASIALVVGGIGIMNVMLIRVAQRKLEIGVRRSVGATQRIIMLQFLAEGCLLAIIGGVLGIGLGYSGVLLYCTIAGWDPYLPATTALLAFMFGVVTGTLFSFWPAALAARQDPVACLRARF